MVEKSQTNATNGTSDMRFEETFEKNMMEKNLINAASVTMHAMWQPI